MIEKLNGDMADQAAALDRVIAAYDRGPGVAALGAAAARLRAAGHPLLLLGMGGSRAACVAAAQAMAMAGTPAAAPDAAEFLHYGASAAPEGLPLVLVSYSGVSAELVEIERALHHRHPIVLVTDKPGTPLGRAADCMLALHCGPELAVATKSFTNTVALLLMLGAALRGTDGASALRGAPARCAALLADRDMGARILSLFGGVPGYLDVMGRGPGQGTALLAGLVLRELLALRGGWMTAGTFRHGPLLDVGEGHGAIVIAGGRTADLGLRMAEDIAARGGRALHITNGAASTAAGVLSVALDVEDEAQFALLAILPVEHFLRAAAAAVGTRYVRVQTETE